MGKIKGDLDLYKLEIFYWVAELKSFSEAAELLSLKQPTVSAHVGELEEALGDKLLYRIPGKVSLTPLGLLLLERAKNLLAFKRETVAAVEQFHGTLSGELWIGGSNIPGEYLLPQKLGKFIKKYPRVKPILRIGDSAGIVEEVLDGKVEIGICRFQKCRLQTLFRQDLARRNGAHRSQESPLESSQVRAVGRFARAKLYFTRTRLGYSGFVSSPAGKEASIRRRAA